MICQMTKSKNQIKYLLNSCELLWWQDKNHQDSYSSLIVSISYSSLTVPSPADKHQFGIFFGKEGEKREDEKRREKTTLFSMDSNKITLHCAIYYKLGRELNKCKLTLTKQFLPLSLNSFCSWHNTLTQRWLAEVSGHLESALFRSLSWLAVVVVNSGLRSF